MAGGFDVAGVDVTSNPRPGKPITLAHGRRDGDVLVVAGVVELASIDAYRDALAALPPSLVAVDHPLGMPRAFLEDLDWPRDFTRALERADALGADGFGAEVAAFRDRRPRGAKHPLRATDEVARAASPVNVVNPPVGRMWQACGPVLLAVGADVRPGGPRRGAAITVVEGYPALVAEALAGTRRYKSESAAGDDAERRRTRAELVAALGGPACHAAYGITVRLPASLRLAFLEDHRADRLDAVLLAVQAAWAGTRPDLGIPEGVDAVEGWIVDPATQPAADGGVPSGAR